MLVYHRVSSKKLKSELVNVDTHMVRGCKILHHQKDGLNQNEIRTFHPPYRVHPQLCDLVYTAQKTHNK